MTDVIRNASVPTLTKATKKKPTKKTTKAVVTPTATAVVVETHPVEPIISKVEPVPPVKEILVEVVPPTPEPVEEVVTPMVIDQAEDEETEETLEEETTSSTSATAGTTTTTTKRSTVNSKEKLAENLDALYTDLEKFFTPSTQKTKSFLRRLKTIRTSVFNKLKIRTGEKTKKDSTNSGFMKPVDISEELVEFLKLDGGVVPDPVTRAMLTTRLCEYIKRHNLQNPSDKRQILPDAALKKLFDLNEADPNRAPLTYYSIQQLIQRHIKPKK